MRGRNAQITVRFRSKLVSVTRDKDGNVIDGNAERVTDITDIWTFARDLSSRDPNWKLLATEAGQYGMPLTSLRSLYMIGFRFWLIAAVSAQADAMNLRNASTGGPLFSALDGWKDDDHAAAFNAFLNSCRAIVNGTQGRCGPHDRCLGGLFKVCERAVASRATGSRPCASFLREQFQTGTGHAGRTTRRLLHRLLRNRGGWLTLPER